MIIIVIIGADDKSFFSSFSRSESWKLGRNDRKKGNSVPKRIPLHVIFSRLIRNSPLPMVSAHQQQPWKGLSSREENLENIPRNRGGKGSPKTHHYLPKHCAGEAPVLLRRRRVHICLLFRFCYRMGERCRMLYTNLVNSAQLIFLHCTNLIFSVGM